jgi:spermidine synthase
MKPWVKIDTATIPGNGAELQLLQSGEDFSIRITGASGELMNSRMHGSEDALAELSCEHVRNKPDASVLIGGLGMGFTLAATCAQLMDTASITVAELIPAVVQWNRGPLGQVAGYPLNDERVTVVEGDVAKLIASGRQHYDAIMLDVDNGPEGLTRRKNNWLYSEDGLIAAYEALRPNGVFAVWSAGPEPAFTQRLRKVGYQVKEHKVRAHPSHKKARHVVWLAQRGA